ncbi:3285_t:CDS:2, partial [Dentiscutata erythropus]
SVIIMSFIPNGKPSNEKKGRRILVTGGTGFIGSHVAKRLHDRGDYVRVVDCLSTSGATSLFGGHENYCSEFIKGNLLNPLVCRQAVKGIQWVFHFAANMGGMGTIHEKNNFVIYSNNHLVSMNIIQASIEAGVDRFFYASSACIYPNKKQLDSFDQDLKLSESIAWCSQDDEPGPDPQGLYGREKLNSETLLSEFVNNGEYSTKIRIARYHNIFGEGGVWVGGKEKAPSALLRKAVCAAIDGNYEMEIWGSGDQRRSFLYIEDCVDATIKLMESDYSRPLNIGSEDAVTIKELAYIAFETVGIKRDQVRLITDETKPVGVQNRNSDNTLVKKILGWSPKISIQEGMKRTSVWIKSEIEKELKNCRSELARKNLINSYRKSELKILLEEIKFGILLPITSRGLENREDCLNNLVDFARSIHETTQADVIGMNGIRFSIKFFIGIDKDDTLFHPIENNPAERILKEHGLMDLETREFNFPPSSICQIWNDLAKDAYDQGCEYLVLFDDSIVLETTNWMSKIYNEFIKISNEKDVPCGFGCVAFNDKTLPGFPTFPVISRSHIEIFNGKSFPTIFTNQDSDVFFFELYRRWECSKIMNAVKLINKSGGDGKPHYKKISHDGSFSALDDAVSTVEKWMQEALENP